MSSNTGYIMTLANSIIGVGILAMPFCFQKVMRMQVFISFQIKEPFFICFSVISTFTFSFSFWKIVLQCGILLSILLLIGSNLVTRLACHYLIKTSIKARRRNLEFIGKIQLSLSPSLVCFLV